MMKRHKKILPIIAVLITLLFFNMLLAEDEKKQEMLIESGNYTLIQHDKKAQEIIIKADRVRWPEKPFSYKLRLMEYRNHQKIKEQFLAITMRLIKPSENIPGDAKVLVRFIEPRELKNDKMLGVFDQVWYYTPKARHPIRISRQQRLMGQVSNGDVVASDFHYSYQSTLIGEEVVEGKLCFKLNLVRRWAFVTYPQITYWVEKETYRPIKAEFYSSSARLMKRAFYKDYREALGDIRPHEIVIEEGLIKNAYTRMVYSDGEFGDVPDVYYQPSYLERMR